MRMISPGNRLLKMSPTKANGTGKMKRLLFTLTTALCMVGLPYQALAITISLTPSSQSIGVSGIAYLNLVISGLGSLASPSLGGFFIDLTYNSAIVSANSVVFGTSL